jgi:hypothetical protein
MANFLYNFGKKEWLNGGIDLLSDTLKVALVTDQYSPDMDADQYFADISDEVVGSGYTAGGKALANRVVTQDDTNNLAIFNADDLTWTVATISAIAAVIYKDTGVGTTSPLLAYINFGETYDTVGNDFTIEWDVDGILSLGDVV